MTIEQTIEVPVNRRITLEVPLEIPVGKARVLVTPLNEVEQTGETLLSFKGSCKGHDTMDAYFARKRADRELEERKSGTN